MFERTNRTRRFYDLDDSSEDAVLASFKFMRHFAVEHGHSTVVVVVQTLGNIEQLARSIGAQNAKLLRKQHSFRSGGVTFVLGTRRDLRVRGDAPVLAVWANDDVLVELDDCQPPALCAVAGSPERISTWLANWRPEAVREHTTALPAAVADVSELLGTALASITVSINIGSGLVDPDDRAMAVGLFRAFRDGNEPCDPAAARTWAVNHGWTAAGAQQLEQVGREVQSGVQHRTVRALPGNILGLWRDKAAGA